MIDSVAGFDLLRKEDPTHSFDEIVPVVLMLQGSEGHQIILYKVLTYSVK